MARGPVPLVESEFERQRLENIAERDALLKKLTAEAQSAGLFSKSAKTSTTGAKSAKKKTPVKRVKDEDLGPRRTSSRIAGLAADSEVAKRKADQDYEQAKEVARIKRLRRTDDLSFGDVVVNGKVASDGLLGTDEILKSVARPYERTFGDGEVKKTTDRDLRSLQEKMSGLELWDAWEPNRLKITPERIYSMLFHPTTTKPIAFAGDKLGNLGIIDASQQRSDSVKEEDNTKIEDKTDDEDGDPVITIIKPHTRTIAAMYTHPSKPETLFTASYDSSVRAIDLVKNMAVELYGPASPEDDEPVSGIDMAATDPNIAYFTTRPV